MSCNYASSYLHVFGLLAERPRNRLSWVFQPLRSLYSIQLKLIYNILRPLSPPPHPTPDSGPLRCIETKQNHTKLTYEVDFMEKNSAPKSK